MKRTIGKNDTLNPKGTIFLSVQRQDNVRQAHIWANTLRDYAAEAPGPDLYLVCIPEWPEQERQVLVFPESGITVVLGIDYVGEVKMGFLRQAMWRAKQERMLSLPSGTKGSMQRGEEGRMEADRGRRSEEHGGQTRQGNEERRRCDKADDPDAGGPGNAEVQVVGTPQEEADRDRRQHHGQHRRRPDDVANARIPIGYEQMSPRQLGAGAGFRWTLHHQAGPRIVRPRRWITWAGATLRPARGPVAMVFTARLGTWQSGRLGC